MSKSYVGMSQCFYCGEAKDVLIDTRMRDKFPSHPICIDQEPCKQCKEYMDIGIIFISVNNNPNKEEPVRTGGWWVLKEEAVIRMLKEEEPKLLARVLEQRYCFIEDLVCETLGLVKESTSTKETV